MITENTIYWITRLDDIKDTVFGIGMSFTMLFGLICLFSCFPNFIDDVKRVKVIILSMIIGIVVGLILVISSAFIPTTKEMCAIKAIPVIMNDEKVQELPDKVVELTIEWIEKFRPNNPKSED